MEDTHIGSGRNHSGTTQDKIMTTIHTQKVSCKEDLKTILLSFHHKLLLRVIKKCAIDNIF